MFHQLKSQSGDCLSWELALCACFFELFDVKHTLSGLLFDCGHQNMYYTTDVTYLALCTCYTIWCMCIASDFSFASYFEMCDDAW